jgi:hypothetical protein
MITTPKSPTFYSIQKKLAISSGTSLQSLKNLEIPHDHTALPCLLYNLTDDNKYDNINSPLNGVLVVSDNDLKVSIQCKLVRRELVPKKINVWKEVPESHNVAIINKNLPFYIFNTQNHSYNFHQKSIITNVVIALDLPKTKPIERFSICTRCNRRRHR